MTRAAIATIDKEELRRRFDLADFVTNYVALESAGSGRYRGCCPFHQEKTPSFYVFDSQCFKCFGCGASGDIFKFVQQIEGVNFLEAKTKLVQGDWRPVLPSPRALRRAPSKPATTWQQELDRADLRPLLDSPAQTYLERRGIPFEIARQARVKYAARWFGKPAVMFPIVGQYGEVLAVQGRLIFERDPKRNKLSKGPKSQGVFVTQGALNQGAFAPGIAICEAPIDALSVATLYGIPSIAVCGSDLTAWVLNAARESVWIATDADAQGDADYEQWAPLFEKHGIEAARLRPTFKDWNEELVRHRFHQ